MGRPYKKDTIHFLHIARGSVYELETLLNIAVMVGILDSEVFSRLALSIQKIARLINGLTNYQETATLK